MASGLFRKAFTLIELLVVIAIIAILAVVVVLVLNPEQLLMQARDANRVSDMATLTNAINIYNTDQSGAPDFSLGSSSIVYTSLIDASSTCGDQGLSPLPSGYTYSCGSSTSSRNINGTGWIPIDFTKISSGAPIGSLPLDPTNQSSTDLYYTYDTNGNQFQLTAHFESQKYASTAENSGGADPTAYTVGSDLSLAPFTGGMVGWWPLDEGSGITAYDDSGFGHNGTWYGTPAGIGGTYYTTGTINASAAYFNGSDDRIDNFLNVSSMNFDNMNFSMTAWVVATNFGGYQVIQAKGGYAGWGFGNEGGGPSFLVDGSDGSQENDCYFGSLNAGQLYFLAGTLNAISRTMQCFVNGNLTNTISLTATTNLGTINGNAFGMGARSGGPMPYWAGILSDVRVYDRVLSASEVAAMYADKK